jgi:hypothetical protein
MSFQEAMDLTDDDLPDGAFFAMSHEIAGLDYGDGFDELVAAAKAEMEKPFSCHLCRKRFKTKGARRQHKRTKHK